MTNPSDAKTNQRAAGFSPETRTALYFLTLFMSGGAATAYAGIWFAAKGLSPTEIGVIGALPMLVMLLFNVLVGRVADRAPDWRQVIIAGSLASSLLPIGLFFTESFAGILTVWTLAAICQMAVTPVADAAAQRMSQRRGSDLSAFRAWATVGFMALIAVTGAVTGWLGAVAFLPIFVAVSLLRGVTSLGLPSLRAGAGETAKTTGARHLGEVMQAWFVLPLLGWSMVYATHFWLNSFQALLWSKQGLSAPLIAGLIALGAAAEAVLFFGFRRFNKRRFPARWLALISGLVTVARWTAMGFSPDVWLLIPLQLLHAITYAIGFMGCVQFISNWTSEDIAAEAQGFFAMLQLMCGVVFIFGGGLLVEVWGPATYWFAAAAAAAGSLLIWLSLQLQQPRAAPVQSPSTAG